VQSNRLPVACVQLDAHDRDAFDARWPHIVERLDEAARRGARFIVLPEGTVPAYVIGTDPLDPHLLERASQDVAAVARARGATIVYGGAKIVDGRTYNAAIVVGPDGRELGHASKQFLWHFDRRWFAPGATLDPIDTPVGRLGALVCADGRVPSIAATLADRGADLLVMTTAWVTSGRDPAALENVQADLMGAVRARENGIPFVACNKVGVERGSVAYCGKSAIVATDGTYVARGPERDETIVFGELTLAREPAIARGELAPPARPRDGAVRERARIAFTLASGGELDSLVACARDADADLVFTGAAERERADGVPVVAFAPDAPETVRDVAGLRVATVRSTLRSPRGLVAARLAGADLIVWHVDGDPAWHVPFARTRAAELRAFVVAFDAGRGRAFAVDPDGAVVAGTFGAYRLATFAYDRARTSATTVAPTTDVLDGLRVAEGVRARGGAAALAGGVSRSAED
jgi:predicted amidohydrolase